jgi:hypothetical protein
MRTRPFLSHRRADRNAVIALKRALAVYGVGGWRDLDDLHLGELGQPTFERAINEVTGGLLWYGTKRVLGSAYVNTVELPPAIARKRREPNYPLVPLFSTVTPREASAALATPGALSTDDHKTFFDAHGLVRGRGRIDEFHREVARRYVRAGVQWLAQECYSVAVTALAEPAGTQDFTFDWRSELDPRARVLAPGASAVVVDALHTFGDAIKPSAEFPEVTLDLDLPLPLAVLLGHEWRPATRLKLNIRQRRRSGIVLVSGDGRSRRDWPAWREEAHDGSGPCVVAVATTASPLTKPLAEYSARTDASRTLELHVPGELDAPGVRGLARYVAEQLRAVNADGADKHLLMAGPCVLAALVGAASNANGPTVVPFWNGREYVSPIRVG